MQDKKKILSVLKEEVNACKECILHKDPGKGVLYRGNVNADIMLLGEGPGMSESEQGLPFVGRAGKLLDKMILAMGLSSEDVYICNVVNHRPPNNRKPEPDEIKACLPFLDKQLEIVKPKIIVALGTTATETLLGPGEGITKRHGKMGKYKDIPVCPSMHPSSLLRNPKWKELAAEDLSKVLKFLKGEIKI